MSIQEQFMENATKTVHISWGTDLSIEDLIYMSTIRSSRIQLSSTFDENLEIITHTECLGEDSIRVKTEVDDSLDKKIILYLIVNGFRHAYIKLIYIPEGPPCDYVFDPDFLQECWTLACQYKVDHHKFGNIIKFLGYKINYDFSDFENQYLNGTRQLKSARK